jgi:cation diffusion facilitator family transporter
MHSDIDHQNEHKHDDHHSHEHDHFHNHAENEHSHGQSSWFKELFHFHKHDLAATSMDEALATNRGIHAVKVSLVGLLATAIFQLGVVAISGSVALLADTIHNFSDALTAIPLWFAFALSRKPRNRRFTYGYGKAEDLAGVFIVIMIFASSIVVFYESIQKILTGTTMHNIPWVMAASAIGFIGNELVALYRIRTGRAIGSAALITDGIHARTDGLTSLGVLVGALGVLLGFPLADPIIGILIGASILVIVWKSAQEMWFRIMDATDPDFVRKIEKVTLDTPGVYHVNNIRMRWSGHQQMSEYNVVVDCQLPTYESHEIAENVRHNLLHAFPYLIEVIIHIDPCQCDRLPGSAHLENHPGPVYQDSP